jgi:hypothetical protein
MKRRGAVFAVMAIALVRSPALRGATPAFWNGTFGGTWDFPANWSTNPYYPINGTPAGATYDAHIDVPGGPYTVTMSKPTAVDSLTVGGGGCLESSSVITISNQFRVLGDTSFAKIKEVHGGTLTTAEGGVFTTASPGCILTGTAIDGEIDAETGLTVHGTIPMTSNGVIRLSSSATLTVASDGDLVGSGQILANGNSGTVRVDIFKIDTGTSIRAISSDLRFNFVNDLILTNNGAVECENGRIIYFQNALENHGTITSTDNSRLYFSRAVNNFGSIIADGYVEMHTLPTGPGLLRVRNGKFVFDGAGTTAQVRAYDIANCTYVINAPLDNTGDVIPVVDGTNIWTLGTGTIKGGTIRGSPGVRFAVNGVNRSVLSDIVVDTDLSVSGSLDLVLTRATVTNGKEIHIAGNLTTTSLSVDAQTDIGSGSVIFLDGTTSRNRVSVNTLPAGVQIVTGTSGGGVGVATNNGLISSRTLGATLQLTSIVNHGRIEANNADVAMQLDRDTGGSATNVGVIALAGAGDFSIPEMFTQTPIGLIEISIGGPGTEQFGQLSALQGIQLDGGLRASLTGGYLPPLGQTFQILSTGSLSGMFNSTVFPTWENGRTFAISYSVTGASLTVVTPEPVTGLAGISVIVIGFRRPRKSNPK